MNENQTQSKPEDEKISIDKVNEAKKVIDNLKYKTNDI
jgi:hypothetical protein